MVVFSGYRKQLQLSSQVKVLHDVTQHAWCVQVSGEAGVLFDFEVEVCSDGPKHRAARWLLSCAVTSSRVTCGSLFLC